MLELPESERRILADRDNLTGPDRERMRNLSLFPANKTQSHLVSLLVADEGAGDAGEG
ncbi:hypothetical protein [Streptomyces sp. MN13]